MINDASGTKKKGGSAKADSQNKLPDFKKKTITIILKSRQMDTS
jgi:hypothetical protein